VRTPPPYRIYVVCNEDNLEPCRALAARVAGEGQELTFGEHLTFLDAAQQKWYGCNSLCTTRMLIDILRAQGQVEARLYVVDRETFVLQRTNSATATAGQVWRFDDVLSDAGLERVHPDLTLTITPNPPTE
jgi:hypothetical protein